MKTQIGSLERKMDSTQDKMEAGRKADKEESMAKMERLLADNREMKATIRSGQEEMIKAITGASRESTEDCEEKTKALPETTEACPEVTPACLDEEKEQAPEETEVMEKSWEVPEGAADEEKFRATEDRAGDLRLAVRRHRQRKKRAHENGGPRQKFAAFRGRFTRRAVPALLKGHVRKGPGKKCRSGIRGLRKGPDKRCSRSSIRRQGKASRAGKRGMAKNNVERGTPKGRTSK
jgi:hypothetical protein